MSDTPEFEGKLCAPAQLAGRIAALPRPLVFTNGVFDILHRGDASARRLGKGADRPINPCEDRMAVLAALQAVDLVTWFDEDTPLALIRACRPDVLAKGGDWITEAIVGAREVIAWGGAVHSIPFLFQRSTTATLNTIRSREKPI